MTHEAAHPHGHGTAAGERPYFPADEWEEFRREDLKAGTFIVLEMGGIFCVGLLLYAIIAFIVSGTPQ